MPYRPSMPALSAAAPPGWPLSRPSHWTAGLKAPCCTPCVPEGSVHEVRDPGWMKTESTLVVMMIQVSFSSRRFATQEVDAGAQICVNFCPDVRIPRGDLGG